MYRFQIGKVKERPFLSESGLQINRVLENNACIVHCKLDEIIYYGTLNFATIKKYFSFQYDEWAQSYQDGHQTNHFIEILEKFQTGAFQRRTLKFQTVQNRLSLKSIVIQAIGILIIHYSDEKVQSLVQCSNFQIIYRSLKKKNSNYYR